MKTCENCGQPIKEADLFAETHDCAKSLATAIQSLVHLAGDPGHCKCGREIYWFRHKRTGALTPYTAWGVNHFLDCANADEFRRKK